MTIYPVLHYLVFTIYVNFNTILYSFKRWNISTGIIEWVGLKNYTAALQIVNLVNDGNYGIASAFGVVLAIVGLVVTGIIKWFLDRNTIVEY